MKKAGYMLTLIKFVTYNKQGGRLDTIKLSQGTPLSYCF